MRKEKIFFQPVFSNKDTHFLRQYIKAFLGSSLEVVSPQEHWCGNRRSGGPGANPPGEAPPSISILARNTRSLTAPH